MSSCWAAACPTSRACTRRCRACGTGTYSPTTSRPAWRDPSTATRAAFAAPHGGGAEIRELAAFLLEAFLPRFALFEGLFFELLFFELFLLELLLFDPLFLLERFFLKNFLLRPLFLDRLAARRPLSLQGSGAFAGALREPLLVACGLEECRDRLQHPGRRALVGVEMRRPARGHLDSAELGLHDRAALVDLVVAAGRAARIAGLEMGRLMIRAAHADRHHRRADLVLVAPVFSDPAAHRPEPPLPPIPPPPLAPLPLAPLLRQGDLGLLS